MEDGVLNKKNKVCIVAPTNGSIGGISTWFSLVKEEAEGFVDVFSIDTSLKNNIYSRGFNLKRKVSQTLRIHNQKKQLKGLINEKHISVLHIATSGGTGFLRDYFLLKYAKRRGIKTILHLHYGRFKNNYLSNSFTSFLCKKCCRFSDLIICIDEPTKKFLDSQKISNRLIYNPIKMTTNTYSPSSEQIIYIGNVLSTKGVLELVNAFKKYNVAKKYNLKIIGPVDESFYPCLNITDGDNIYICGPQNHDETMNELCKSKVLILPSYSEGMPYSILESMARSIPVVATDVGNIPFMLNGCGIIIKPKSEEDIFNALTKLEDKDVCLRLSVSSFERAMNMFSSKVIVNELLNLWRTI